MHNRIGTDMWLQLEIVNNALLYFKCTHVLPNKNLLISALLISYKVTHNIFQFSQINYSEF